MDNKNYIIKGVSTFVLSIVFSISFVYAQSIDENITIRSSINSMFSGIDKTKVPTQLLLDYAIDLVELSNYNGRTLTDSNYISLIDYENILRSISSACVTTSKPFDTVENIIESFTSDNNNSSIKISIALYKYNRIKANALEENLIRYNPILKRVYDKYEGETWINPYEEVNLLAFAPNRHIVRCGETFSLELPSEFIFSNNITNINYVFINASDGLGWRGLTANHPISIQYDSAGEKELIIRVSTKDQGTLFAHTKILVEPSTANQVNSKKIPFIEYPPIDTIYNGATISATLLLSSADNSNLIKKPFIFIEGFDPGPFVDTVLGEALGSIGQYGMTDIDMISYSAWEKSIKRNGYDLIYVNWNNSLADIRANAALLEKILNVINQHKHNNGSDEKNILMGHSMGGLISRYALCDMESKNAPHEVSTYISFDSPHLGANIPLGALYFIPQAINLLYNTNIPHIIDGATCGLLDDTKQALYDIMHAQSVRQMLMNYVDTYGKLNNSTYDEWQAELRTKGFPRGDAGIGISNIAIANGGEIINNKVDNTHYLLIDGYAQTKTLTETIFPILSHFSNYEFATTMMALNLPFIADLFAIWGSSRIDWHAEVNPLSKNNTSGILSKILLTYKKKYLWILPMSYTLFDEQAIITSDITNYADDYYASSYNIHSSILDSTVETPDNILIDAQHRIGLTNKIGFIPTASALCYKSGENVQHSDYLIDFHSNNNICQIDTPFDGIYLTNAAESHMYNTNNMFDWIINHSNMKIEGDAIARHGSVYTCPIPNGGATIKWSTSNPEIATINEDTGVLSVIGNGEVDIIAKSEKEQGVLYGTRKKIVVNFPNIIINSEYENNLGYKFTTQFISEDSSLLAMYNSMIANGSLRYEWSLIDGDGNMTTKTTSSNIFTYLPEQDEVVSICVRLVDSEGNKGEIKSTTINLRAPFDVNYRYVVVDSYQNTYFIKSDDTYEVGTPTEQFTITFRNLVINPTDNALSTQLKQTYLKGNTCYLAYPSFKSYIYWTGTKVSMQDKWRFSFFNTSQFLNLLNDVLNNAGGEESSISVFPMVICNTEKEKLQSVPFAVIYKPTFPEN